MRVSDRLSAPERERIVPGDSELACLIRDFDESQTDLEAPQYWPENLRLAGKKGVRDLVMERCCALHNFRVCLRPWASDGLIGINSIGQHDKRPRAIPCRAVFVVQRVSLALQIYACEIKDLLVVYVCRAVAGMPRLHRWTTAESW